MGYTIKNSDIYYKGTIINLDFLTSPFLLTEGDNIILFNSDEERLEYITNIKKDYNAKKIKLDNDQIELLNDLEKKLKGKELIKK